MVKTRVEWPTLVFLFFFRFCVFFCFFVRLFFCFSVFFFVSLFFWGGCCFLFLFLERLQKVSSCHFLEPQKFAPHMPIH